MADKDTLRRKVERLLERIRVLEAQVQSLQMAMPRGIPKTKPSEGKDSSGNRP